MRDIVQYHNICPDDLVEANRDRIPAEVQAEFDKNLPFNGWMSVKMPELIIPPHGDCFDFVTGSQWDFGRIERQYNVCMEEFYNAFGNTAVGSGMFVPRNKLPCLNEKGKRLQYLDEDAKALETPRYVLGRVIEGPRDLMTLGYCLGDIARANRFIYFSLTNLWGMQGYLEGMSLVTPLDVRLCDFISGQGTTLYQLSRDTNVCMEVLLEASGRTFTGGVHATFSVPKDAPLCYNRDGHRIGSDGSFS